MASAEDQLEAVKPAASADKLTEFWSQRVIGQANGSLFKVAKGIGSTTWHSHDDQEEAHFLLVGPELTSNAAGGKPAWSYTHPLRAPRS